MGRTHEAAKAGGGGQMGTHSSRKNRADTSQESIQVLALPVLWDIQTVPQMPKAFKQLQLDF